MEGHTLAVFQGRGLYLGDFSWVFYYHIISYCIVLSSHGGKAPGMAGILACLLKLLFLADGRAGHCCVAAGSRLSERLANSAASYVRAAEPELRSSLGHPMSKRLLYTSEVKHQQRPMKF